jgi:hypothetical protein
MKKKKKNQKPTAKYKPTTTNHHKKTHKPTITANPQTHHHSTSELESHRVALNHELIDLINRLIGSGSGAASIAEV